MTSIAVQKVDELGGRMSVLTRQRREHIKLEDLLEDLEGATGAARGQALFRIHRLFFPYAFAEEDGLLPQLQEELDRTRLRGLGLAWEVLHRSAPTGAHPVVAGRPPGSVVAAVPLSVLDRVRDLGDAAGLCGPGRSAPVLRPVSTRLGAPAHGIEHLPVIIRW